MSSKSPVTDFVERCSKQAKAADVKLPAYVLIWLTNFVDGNANNLNKVTMEIHKPACGLTKAVFKGFPVYGYLNHIFPPSDDFVEFAVHTECTSNHDTYTIVVELPQQSKKEEPEPLPPYLSEVPSGPMVDYSDDDDIPPPLVEWESSPSHTEITPPVLKQSDDEESLPPLEGFEPIVAKTAEAILTIFFKHSVSKERCAIIASVLGCHRTDLVDRLTQCVIDTAKFPEAELRLALALRLLEKSYE